MYAPDGVLTIRYAGESQPVTFTLSPAPKPRVDRLTLTWAGQFVLDGTDPPGGRFALAQDVAALMRLRDALQRQGPITVTAAPTAPEVPAGRATIDRGTTSRGTDASTAIDPAVFSDPRPAAFLRAAAERWAPRAPLPSAAVLTPTDVEAFVRSSPQARALAATISRTWKQYAAAGGTDSAQYALLAETLLVQAERENPSARPGVLTVAAQPFGWGLYRNKVRWYDDHGLPVIGPAGVFWDHTYAPDAPGPYAVRVAIERSEVYTVLTAMRQAVAGGFLIASAAAQGYRENVDLLLPAVLSDWDFLDQLSDEVVGMLPLLVAFLGVELVARLLILTGHPALITVGLALRGLGWVVEVAFYGHLAVLAVRAGTELLLVRRRPDGTLDTLSARHLDAAAKLVRELIVLMVTILAIKGLPEAGRAVWATGKAAAAAGGKAAKAVATGAGQLLAIRPELAPAWAGAYGEGASFEMVAMRGERGSGGRTPEPVREPARQAPEPPAGSRPPNWAELEKAVTREFHDTAAPNSATYYTSRSHKLSKIWREFAAYVQKLRESGLPDPLAEADASALTLTRQQLVAGTPLEAAVAQRLARLQARLREANRAMAEAGDARTRAEAKRAADQWAKEAGDWVKWMNTKVGDQKLDLFELNPTSKEAAVVDPSFAWADPVHNLKSQVYLLSFNRLLGWRGGSAIDVGRGRFQSRIFLGSTTTPPAKP